MGIVMLESLRAYQAQVRNEVFENILPFYINHAIDEEDSGFYGEISNDNVVSAGAPKGLIQNSRLLWTFAHADRVLPNPVYRQMADRAFDYLVAHFWDDDHGGLHWLLDHRGRVVDVDKVTYGQAFGIYGFSEYFLATGNPDSLERAITLYQLLEANTYDFMHAGYFERCQRNWELTGASQLGHGEPHALKTMNTHLHMMEAYTNLLRAWDDAELRAKLTALVRLTIQRIVDNQTGHFKLFFDAEWNSLEDIVSYGHDIEGSWLLVEAAEALGDEELLAEVKPVARQMAQATYAKGVDVDGGIFNEGDSNGVTDVNKDWWPQAEAMVGFLNAYQMTGETDYLQASLDCWRFVQAQIIDHEHGEWLWGVTPAGKTVDQPKTGVWKSPYHNGRACFEVMRRVESLVQQNHDNA